METEGPTAVLLIAGVEVFHLLRPFLKTSLQRSKIIMFLLEAHLLLSNVFNQDIKVVNVSNKVD